MSAYSDNFNINLTHYVPTPAPETGGGAPNTGIGGNAVSSFGDFVASSPAIIAIIISLAVVGLVVFFLRRKLFANKRLATISTVAIFALLFGFSSASYTALNHTFAEDSLNSTLDVIATNEGATASVNIPVNVAASDLSDATLGYTVYAYLEDVAGGLATDTALYNKDSSASIVAAETSVSSSDELDNNTYAIRDADGNYTSISTDSSNPTKIYTTTVDSTTGSTFYVTYAAKADTTLPEGNYAYTSQQVHYIVEKNVATFDAAYAAAGKTKDVATGLYKMQDMSTSICSAVASPTSTTSYDEQTTTLLDARDGKAYWVTKLADGNCWMTQNLDLGGASSMDLTSDDTDLASGNTFTLPASDWGFGDDTAYIYDPGSQYLPGGTSSSVQSISCNGTDTRDENCHWHQGNYYNWNAATAGSNVEDMSMGQNAPQSICPKGWKIANKAFLQDTFITQLGLTFNNSSSAPTYLTRTGYVYMTGGSIQNIGSQIGIWSSDAYGKDGPVYYYAYILIGNSMVGMFTSTGQTIYGYGVRCVAR